MDIRYLHLIISYDFMTINIFDKNMVNTNFTTNSYTLKSVPHNELKA